MRSKSSPKSLAIMKSWLAAAKRMYRHVLVNSLASSASSGSSSISCGARRENSRRAAASPSGVRAEMIWGSSRSSVMERPWAMRSGQKQTRLSSPRSAR